MNTLTPLRLAALTAIAASPLGLMDAAQAQVRPGNVVVPTISTTGTNTVSRIDPATAPSIVVPVYSYPATTAPSYPNYPSTPPASAPVTSPTPLPAIPSNRPVVSNPANPTNASGLIYRVVVANASETVQQQVQRVVPNAFRTSVNGRSVIQAGVFREASKATELQQQLTRSNVQATIVPTQASALPTTPPPSRVPAPSANAGALPSVPKTSMRVVIDPGHGGGDPGAVGIGGIRESEVVLDISRQVVNLLKQQGVDAVLTRSRDEEIELEPRVAFAERANGDVFVSIHANAFDASRTDVNGIETYYYSGGGSGSRQLAQLVQTSMIQSLGARDRGVRTANFYVIKNTSMPAILVETGFVTGREDADRFATASGRSQIAQAIARGILQYIKQAG